MKCGSFTLAIVSDGSFWLDGGAMFGIVPKVLWSKLNPADERNRIKLGLNCLLVQTPERKVLIDTGVGKKLDEKFKEIYRIEQNSSLIESLHKIGVQPEDIDFVVNTHLHFDHCGGNTVERDGDYIPTFPNAKYVIQKQEWFDATHTNERTKASYLPETFKPIKAAGQLLLVDGDCEVLRGISVVVTSGHTRGHQSVMIESEHEKAIYFGDLVPTSSHVKIPYIMGYDLFPLEAVETKKKILKKAIDEHWLLIFEHDPKTAFAYLIEENGREVLKPVGDESLKSKPENEK